MLQLRGLGGGLSLLPMLSCNICKKNNHESKDCYFKDKKRKNGNHHDSNWKRSKEDHGFANLGLGLFALIAEEANKIDEDTWILDSGCSAHMTGNEDLLVDGQETQGENIYSSRLGRYTLTIMANI
jgi:hypothetical protein